MRPVVEAVDCVVIGAGVVGLAVARALAQGGHEVLVLEGENAIGTQTSARSSEVIHAGIYYPPGSWKARLCVRGKDLLYAYCAERSVGYRRCGKFIVATSQAQVARLGAIARQAAANSVGDLVLLSAAQAQAAEPALQCLAALHSPSTGIVDSHGLMLSLHGDLTRAGGLVALNSAVAQLECGPDAIIVVASDGTRLAARAVVNAAGLRAPALAARMAGLDARHVPRAYFAKGSYFTLAGKAPFSRLVYPVPEPGGLGVHLTLDLGGGARFGPDVQWVDDPGDLAVDPARAEAFYAGVRRYWPDLPEGALQPAYAGIRPKISAPGQPDSDFSIQGPNVHGIPGLVNLFGIESPGLTAALAIGEAVTALVGAPA